MVTIEQSVGDGGVNRDADVRVVQALLNAQAAALGIAPLAVDGLAGPLLADAIRRCQVRLLHLAEGDGRVDPGGRTFRVLSGADAAAPTDRLSGAAWWAANQARFPNSVDMADLDPAFRGKASAFIAALRQAGATVVIQTTRRDRLRAYLMHYSWKVAKSLIKAVEVPLEPVCGIVWDHGSDGASVRAAREMVDEIGVVFQPSLNSQHIPGLAVDISIKWSGTITLRDAGGAAVAVSAPNDGSNPNLHRVGATYGVIKLLSDPPHWSIDGH